MLGRAGDLRRQLADVVADVAALGHLLAARPRADRLPELLDLGPGVVEVVLARHRVAGEAEHARQRVAVGGVAAAGRGQRARRVGRDELDVDPQRRRRAAAAVAVAGREHPVERADVPGVGEEQVQEARAGDLDALERLAEAVAQRAAQPLGHLARRRLEHAAPARAPRWSRSRRDRPAWGARASAATSSTPPLAKPAAAASTAARRSVTGVTSASPSARARTGPRGAARCAACPSPSRRRRR